MSNNSCFAVSRIHLPLFTKTIDGPTLHQMRSLISSGQSMLFIRLKKFQKMILNIMRFWSFSEIVRGALIQLVIRSLTENETTLNRFNLQILNWSEWSKWVHTTWEWLCPREELRSNYIENILSYVHLFQFNSIVIPFLATVSPIMIFHCLS